MVRWSATATGLPELAGVADDRRASGVNTVPEMDESAAANARTAEEISQRGKAEKKLRTSKGDLEARILDRTRALRTLTEANQTLVHAADEEQLLRDVCRVVVELGGYRMAWVGFAEHDEEKSIRPVASAGDASRYLEQLKVSWGTGPTSQGPVGTSIRERKPMVARETRNHPELAGRMVETLPHDCESVIGLPLFDSEGAVFGVLVIYADEPDAFDAEEEALLSELAGDLAYGIGALRERDKRAAAEATVRKAASYARSIIEAAPDPLVAISPEGAITDVNTAAEEATGIPRDTLIGTDFASYLTEPDRARTCFKKVLEEGLVRDFPLTLKRASGEVMDVLYSGTVYGNEAGEPQGVLVTARDVTEAKRVQAQVARLAAIVTSSQDAIFTKNLDGIVTSWNAAAEALYGYSAQEMIGTDVAVLTLEEREAEPRQLVERVRQGERIVGFETQRKRKDGSLVEMSLTLSPILNDAGDIVAVSVVGHEITERKRAERALQNSEERLRLEVSRMPIGYIVWDEEFRAVTWNPAAEDIFGFASDEVEGRHPYETIVPPEAQPEVDDIWRRLLTGDTSAHSVNENTTKDGRTIICDWTNTPLKQSDGTVLGVMSMVQDVTDRMRAEEALREERGLFVGGPTVVFKWKAEEGWPVEYVSPNVADQFGYTTEELTSGRVPYASIVHPDDIKRVRAEVSSCGEQGTASFEQIYRIAHPDGHYRWVDDFTTVIRGRDGAITHYLGYVLDITERKQADEELARSRELLQGVMDFSPSLIYLLDMEGRFLFVNTELAELLRTPREELIGKNRSQMLPKAIAEQHRANDLEVLNNRQPAIFTEENVIAGETRYYHSVKFPLLDSNGDVYAIGGISTDVTERIRAEEALRESETSLKEAQRLAGIGSWDWNTDTDTITWSEEYYRIYGIDPTQPPPGYEDHLKAYTPESAALLDAAVQMNIQTGEPYEIDLELARTGGPPRWITARSETKRDSQGRIIGLRGTAQDITERKHAEEALKGTAARLNDAQRIAHLGSWELDVVNNVLVWSDEIYQMFEIDPTEFGASYEAFLNAIHPEDREAVNSAYTNSLETRTPYAVDHRLLFPDGRIKYVHEECETKYDEEDNPIRSSGTVQDVTERIEAEEALRASQAKLALHLEQTLLGVIEWDSEFRAREWNPAATAIFGYSREEAIGRRATDLILPEAARPQVDSVFQELMRQQGGQFNTNENITKDGRTILCEWVNTPLTDASGAVVGVMSLARDVTERRQAEEFRIAKEAAEAASAAKSAFLANMSHEIRTPMNAILGFSELMRHDKGLSERQRQQLDTINSSGEHLLALINDVLEMSRIEAGRISANPTAFSLHALLDEMDSLFGLRAEAKGLELRVVRSDELPRFVITDENKLRQVFVNLLGNAVKFTEEGSVELRVAVRRDEAGLLRLLAEVEDTGRGIAPEDTGRLFQYFEQAAAGRAAETGTGLGLAISREFVRLLGGDIAVDSTLGVGSVFKFDIVIEEAGAGAARGGTEKRRVEGLLPGEPHYRVLVADDAQDNRELLVQLLEPVGFSVRTASDGKEALDAFEHWRPQLILMDMRMPVMDGYEATRRIRATPSGDDVAIIGVTASAFAEMRQGVFDAGVDEFIVKPFHEAELFDKIGKLLGVRYVYEERAEEIEQEAANSLDPAAIAALPSDLVSRLKQAAVNADFDAVLELADEVGHHDNRSASALRTLAERFDSERILAALPGGEDS